MSAFSFINSLVKPVLKLYTGKDEWIDIFNSIFGDLKKYWSSKTLIVLGPTASGKDSLLNRLQKKSAVTDHSQTRGVEEVNKYKLSWPIDGNTIEINAAPSLNVGGEIDQRERYWKDACEPCDVIFYLVDAEKFKNNKEACLKRFKDDLKWIVSNSQFFKKDFKLTIILNKIDLIMDDNLPDEENDKNVSVAISEITEISKKILSIISSRLVGVFPLSTTNDYLFAVDSVQILKETMGEV